MINNVVIVGRLTKDIEVKLTANGKRYGYFTLAVNRNKENTDFISCIAWEKTVEIIELYSGKGAMIGIIGRIQTRKFDDKNGSTHYVTEVVVREVQLLGNKSENTNKYPSSNVAGKQTTQNSYNNDFDIYDDDIAF